MSIFAATYSTLRMGNYINIGNTGFQSARNGELATGKGFADLVLIPRKNVDSPAIVIELQIEKSKITDDFQISCPLFLALNQ
jgi:hypothetical protein